MANPEIALAHSAACFGLVIGIFGGYAVRPSFRAATTTDTGSEAARPRLQISKRDEAPRS
jgi:hypothetical protein